MANYVFVYRGGGGMPETEAEQQAVMADWTNWYQNLGPAIVDGGNPFGPSATVASGGEVSQGAVSGLTGYTVIAADSLDAASQMAKGCPILKNDGQVDVYETFNVL